MVDVEVRLVNLVMVLAVSTHGKIRVEDDATLRPEEPGVCVQTVNVQSADPSSYVGGVLDSASKSLGRSTEWRGSYAVRPCSSS